MALVDDLSALSVLARRLTGNSADAEDLVQDTLERALRARGRYDEQGNRFGWLATILRNRFRDGYRASRRRATPCDGIDQLAMPEPAEQAAWERVTDAQLDAALDQLDAGFRNVYALYSRGLSYAEIAHELGISINTVGTRLLRARAKLKAILDTRLC